MSLVGRTIRLKESGISLYNVEVEGRDFVVIDKYIKTSADDINSLGEVYLISSIKTGSLRSISPDFLTGAKILPGEEQN